MTVGQEVIRPDIIEPAKMEEKRDIAADHIVEPDLCGDGNCGGPETAAGCPQDCDNEKPVPKKTEAVPETAPLKPGVSCGGWSQWGEIVCDCDGEIEESTCPADALCDSGTDICHGTCGDCKCYAGGKVEMPCNGIDIFYTDICSRLLPPNPTNEQTEACLKSGGLMQCADGLCRCFCQ